MAKSYDAIIIGAGIIGCATSLALGRKGWKVLNLDRLPAVRETLRQAGIPLLLLEGDCSLRSIEQQRTRIEAFIEMLD